MHRFPIHEKTYLPGINTHVQADYLVQAQQAQFSLYEAQSAGQLNNYILLFTVVTVIFVSFVYASSHI
jgi:hypothetical protein